MVKAAAARLTQKRGQRKKILNMLMKKKQVTTTKQTATISTMAKFALRNGLSKKFKLLCLTFMGVQSNRTTSWSRKLLNGVGFFSKHHMVWFACRCLFRRALDQVEPVNLSHAVIVSAPHI
jgi:hypothetical protein